MKKIILNLFVAISALMLLNACVKDKYDGPESGCIVEKPEGDAITIADLKANYTGAITEDKYVEGTVISDDETGNFYKKLIIQDSTGGVSINVDRTNLFTTFPANRNVYIKLKGLYLNNFGELNANASGDRLLNSLVDEHIKRGACFQNLAPDTVAITDLGPAYVNKLVTILGVEFTNAPSGITYADAVNQATVNLDLADCNSNSIIVRNSGFASFAGDTVVKGNGSITGVFNIFGSDKQLFIRSTKDLNMNEVRCNGSGGSSGSNYLNKDFDDNSLTSGGWTTFQESGTVNWTVGNYQTYYYANITNYNSGSNSATEAWLISPSIDLSSSTSPVLNFRNAYKYNGDPLVLKVSTDFVSGNPTAATWTDLTYTASSGNFSWVDSDDVLLTSYKTSNVHIAFKYTGSNSDGSNWEVDNIVIKEL